MEAGRRAHSERLTLLSLCVSTIVERRKPAFHCVTQKSLGSPTRRPGDVLELALILFHKPRVLPAFRGVLLLPASDGGNPASILTFKEKVTHKP